MWYLRAVMPGHRPAPRYRLALALGAAAALSLALRLPFLSVPLITDEGGYAYVAYWLAHGQALYRDLWFDRPQGIFLVYGAILRLGGGSTESIRLAAGLYNAVTTVLVGLLGARLFGRRAGIGAAFACGLASASPLIEGFTANGEVFMNLPVVLAVLLAVLRRPALAGLALALATAIKPTALPAAGPAVLAALLVEPAWRVSRPALAGALARCAGGFLLGLLPFAAHGLATDPGAYWYAVVGFRVQAHSAFSVGFPLLGELSRSAPSVLAALLPLWLLALCGLGGGRWRRPGGLVALVFLAGAVLGAAAGGYWYWHYDLGLVPPAALLAGAGADRLLGLPWRRPVTRAPRAPRAPRAAGAVAGVAAGAVLLALVVNVRLVGATPGETSWRIYRRPAYLASEEIARYVAARTTGEDTIYAAFAQADLYYLSRRRCAGSHLYWTEINRVPGALDAVLATLDDPARRPAYVIRVDPELEAPGRADPFWARVDRLYRPETAIQGFRLYRRLDAPAAPAAPDAPAPVAAGRASGGAGG